MIDIDIWMKYFLKALDETFKQRVWFVGIQGSYARGEATENSDIDMVVILDELTINDLQIYDRMLDTLSYRELICGFLSGKGELMNWDAADLFQFYYDTKPIKGSLDDLLVLIDDTALNRAIKIDVCNIYHGCVHNMLYDKSEDILKGYERYTKDTKKRLSKLKQDGIEEGMMAKMGAKMGIKKEVIHDNSDSNIADLLIRGISMGSIDMEKKIERYQDNVEKDNLKLAKDFYQFQQENIEALKKFL